MDSRVSVLEDAFEYKDYTVTLVANPYVSPFRTYTSKSVTPPSGKQIITAYCIYQTSSTNCVLVDSLNNNIRCYGTQETDIRIRVLFG